MPRRPGPVCRSCGEDVIWVQLDTGKRMPLDVYPQPDGTVALAMAIDRAEGRVLTAAERVGYEGPLYRSHFATCPQARAWRTR